MSGSRADALQFFEGEPASGFFGGAHQGLADAVVRVGLEVRLLPPQRLEFAFGRPCLAALKIAPTVGEGASLPFNHLADIDRRVGIDGDVDDGQTVLFEQFVAARERAIALTDHFHTIAADDPNRAELWEPVMRETDTARLLRERWLQSGQLTDQTTPFRSISTDTSLTLAQTAHSSLFQPVKDFT